MKCSVCGKHIVGEHIEFDGVDFFCSHKCATKFFYGDKVAVDILLDSGDRLTWVG